MSAADAEWLQDFLVELFKSPTWEVPIMSFIDSNAGLFENSDENKLVYTSIHQEFCTLVEQLLEQHLEDVGMTALQFSEVCMQAKGNSEFQSLVMDQVLAMDDFLTFKKLMIRRNAELQLEAVRQLRHGSFDSMPSFDEGTGTPHFSPLVRPSAPLPSDFTLTDAFALPPQDDTVALEAALIASMFDVEENQRQAELEVASLEAAIAASLAFEEERLRRERELREEDESLTKEAMALSVELAALVLQPPPTHPPAAVSKDATGSGPQHPATPVLSAGVAAPAIAPPAQRVSAPASSQSSYCATTIAPVARTSQPLAPAEAVRAVVDGRLSGTTSATSKLADLPSLTAKAPRSQLLDTTFDNMFGPAEDELDLERQRRDAEELFRANRSKLAALREDDASKLAGVSDAELRRRADHLRKQRDLIVAKNNEERKRQLEEHNAPRVAASGGKVSSSTHAALGTTVTIEPHTGAGAGTSHDSTATSVEEKRLAMRMALAARLRADVTDASSDKV